MVNDDFIIVARVGAPHGVKGMVKIHSFTSPKENIIDYHPWYIRRGKTWQTVETEQCEHRGELILAQFAGCSDREKAAAYTNCDIAITRDMLPALANDEYYWCDLEGLTVIDKDGKTLGTSLHMMETGANDVLVVKGEKEFGIPFILNDVILEVDLENKVIRVDWEPLY